MLFKLYVMITHKYKVKFSKSYMKPTAEVHIIVGTNFIGDFATFMRINFGKIFLLGLIREN